MRLPDTETIDKLFLELSQFTNASTRKELDLYGEIVSLRKDVEKLKKQVDCCHEWGTDGAHSTPVFCKKCFKTKNP